MTKRSPPKWADHFLEWYCNPSRLEAIQGDAYELYDRTLKFRNKMQRYIASPYEREEKKDPYRRILSLIDLWERHQLENPSVSKSGNE